MKYWSIGKETAALTVYSIRVPLNDLRLRILIAVAVLALLIVETRHNESKKEVA